MLVFACMGEIKPCESCSSGWLRWHTWQQTLDVFISVISVSEQCHISIWTWCVDTENSMYTK